MQLKKGFTLIELLVAIAVIGILSTIVLASLNTSRAKSRNSKRLSDIRQLMNAYNAYYSDNGFFPNSGGGWACASINCYDGWAIYGNGNQSMDSGLYPYLPTKPTDPVGGNRGYGGYMYAGPSITIGYTGAFFIYALEPPYTTCPIGYVNSSGSDYVVCLFYLGN